VAVEVVHTHPDSENSQTLVQFSHIHHSLPLLFHTFFPEAKAANCKLIRKPVFKNWCCYKTRRQAGFMTKEFPTTLLRRR
jgi:hypothetical protein